MLRSTELNTFGMTTISYIFTSFSGPTRGKLSIKGWNSYSYGADTTRRWYAGLLILLTEPLAKLPLFAQYIKNDPEDVFN